MRSCDEVRGSLAAFLVDNLDADEKHEIEAHVEQCAACSIRLENLKALTGVLKETPLGPEPDPELERHVFALVRHDDVARLAREAPILPAPPADLEERVLSRAEVSSGRVERKSIWPRVTLALTPAFGAAAIIMAVLLITNDGPVGPTGPVDRPTGHFLQEIRLTGAGEADLALTHFRQDNYRLTLTDTDELPPLSEGHHYELWLKGDAGWVSAGGFRYESSDDFAIDFNVGVDPTEYSSVEITEEPDDGDPQPTGDRVCRGSFDTEYMKDF